MPSQIEICNLALSELPATPIQSMDEESLEARECRRHYPRVIAKMLEGPHDWSFQNRRAILALVTNTRDSEWVYAYALPANMATPIRVLPDFTALGIGLPVPLPGEPYAETWAAFAGQFEMPYIIENGVLYTNVETATLEYGANDVLETVLPAMVVDAVVTELAARLAVPVKKDKDLRKEKLSEAEVYWTRAIADDRNREPTLPSTYIPEALLARAGYC